MKYSYFKHLILFSLFFQMLSSTSHAAIQIGKPLLVILLMVKNEKARIVQTLETYVSKENKDLNNGEVAYFIYDTGSHDGTETIAEDFFNKTGIKNYIIHKEEWNEPEFPYARARNRALELVREKYADSTFILFPDAEWYLHTVDNLVTFCKEEAAKASQGTELPCYYRNRMHLKDGNGRLYVSFTSRLILTHDDIKFENERHECPNKASSHHTPASIYFDIVPSNNGAERSKKRWESDRDYFLNQLLEDAKNPRAALYAGLSEKWLGNYRNAYTYLKIRRDLSSFPQEDYYALFNLAETTEILMASDPERFTWDEALKYYLEAYSLRPHRAEPLVKIASHYFFKEQKYGLSYLFAKRASELAMPEIEKEILPILLDYYDYERWYILGCCSYYVQEYEVGEEATRKAIEAEPNAAGLYRNLSFYWDKKN